MTCEIRERKAFAKQVEQNPDLLKHAAILESETQLVGVGGHAIEVTATTEPEFPQVEVGEFYVGTKPNAVETFKPKAATKKVPKKQQMPLKKHVQETGGYAWVEQELAEMRGQPQGTEARVCDDITERQALGLNKYGQTVANNPLTLKQWMQHAYEEALDMAIYLKRAMEEMK